MDNIISREEKLFRNVITNPSFWKTATGKPSSALFKDSKGVSVDRDGVRDYDTIVETFRQRFRDDNIKAIIYVNAAFCLDLGTHLIYKPEHDNIYHSEIHGSPDKIAIHPKIAKQLASECSIVYLKE
jgi:hypothetical protein